jgi:hypothetical protein
VLLVAADGAEVVAAPDRLVTVPASPVSWSYAALLTIPSQLISDFGDYPALVHIRARVDRAHASFDLLKKDRSGWIDIEPLSRTANAIAEVVLAARDSPMVPISSS